MPIEIRELVIRTVVTASGGDDDDDEGGTPGGGSALSETDMIIQECVRQVLRILRKERER